MNWIIYATAIVAGLLIGSFLNVVIHRGPAMWGLVEKDRGVRGTFIAPRSYCPACNARIPIADLIPVLNYLFLGGKCRRCGAPIPLRYPLVELTGAAATATALVTFGATWEALAACLFFFALIALAAIDAETGYLPDAITLPLAGLGLLVNAGGLFVPWRDAALGAVAGYAAFIFIAWGYRKLRGHEGLGGGDAKLLAALGAWGGWIILAPAVFLGAASALAFLAAARLAGRPLTSQTPVPFGPGLCFGGAVAFMLQVLDIWLPPLP